jgi:hypothetical protein
LLQTTIWRTRFIHIACFQLWHPHFNYF